MYKDNKQTKKPQNPSPSLFPKVTKRDTGRYPGTSFLITRTGLLFLSGLSLKEVLSLRTYLLLTVGRSLHFCEPLFHKVTVKICEILHRKYLPSIMFHRL